LPDAELFEPVCNLLHRRPSTIDLVQICIMAGTLLRELAPTRCRTRVSLLTPGWPQGT
jgi:hypothetical protein